MCVIIMSLNFFTEYGNILYLYKMHDHYFSISFVFASCLQMVYDKWW